MAMVTDAGLQRAASTWGRWQAHARGDGTNSRCEMRPVTWCLVRLAARAGPSYALECTAAEIMLLCCAVPMAGPVHTTQTASHTANRRSHQATHGHSTAAIDNSCSRVGGCTSAVEPAHTCTHNPRHT
jgi:hypothetical protein